MAYGIELYDASGSVWFQATGDVATAQGGYIPSEQYKTVRPWMQATVNHYMDVVWDLDVDVAVHTKAGPFYFYFGALAVGDSTNIHCAVGNLEDPQQFTDMDNWKIVVNASIAGGGSANGENLAVIWTHDDDSDQEDPGYLMFIWGDFGGDVVEFATYNNPVVGGALNWDSTYLYRGICKELPSSNCTLDNDEDYHKMDAVNIPGSKYVLLAWLTDWDTGDLKVGALSIDGTVEATLTADSFPDLGYADYVCNEVKLSNVVERNDATSTALLWWIKVDKSIGHMTFDDTYYCYIDIMNKDTKGITLAARDATSFDQEFWPVGNLLGMDLFKGFEPLLFEVPTDYYARGWLIRYDDDRNYNNTVLEYNRFKLAEPEAIEELTDSTNYVRAFGSQYYAHFVKAAPLRYEVPIYGVHRKFILMGQKGSPSTGNKAQYANIMILKNVYDTEIGETADNLFASLMRMMG